MHNNQNYPVIDKVIAQKYSSDFDIPHELAQILAVRFPAYNEAKKFLFPDIADLHDPWLIPDISEAVDMIMASIKTNEKILVYCHDDPDGYTAAAIMYQSLIDITKGQHERIFVYPIVRERDGYILNPEVLREYREKGVKLVITVDFGISSLENFKIAAELGLKLVVCDHHETNRSSFPAPAVDPKRPESHYPFRELAGVGVSFKLAQCLYQKAFKLKTEEFYSLKKNFFPLLMLGTLSDRVALLDENRIFSSYGLTLFNKLDKPWMKYFRENKEDDLPVFPRELNSTIGSAAYVDPNFGVEVFLSNDFERVSEIVGILQEVNKERQQGVEKLLRAAIAAAKIYPQAILSIIPFSKQHYLGSVAARLKEQYKRTAIVIGLKENMCFGELRSNTIDLFKMLNKLGPLFLDFGGHSRAAGFTMSESHLDKLTDDTITYLSNDDILDNSEKELSLKTQPIFLFERTKIGFLQPLVPFGEGNPAPLLTDGTNIYTIDNRLNIIEKELDG
ncbi:MAG: DHH family phosphoesterase [bacterium]